MEPQKRFEQKIVLPKGTVNTFIKRVQWTFGLLLLCGIVIITPLIYLPFKTALEKSLLENFDQLSHLNYQTLVYGIERQSEGARAIASRTMIKNAIYDYNAGKMNVEELKAYTKDKYEDGLNALDHLINAERWVNNIKIAEFKKFDNEICQFEPLTDYKKESVDLCVDNERVYLLITSPIIVEDYLLAYDQLVFDLTDVINIMKDTGTEVNFLNNDEYQQIINNNTLIKSENSCVLLRGAKYSYEAGFLFDDIYLLSTVKSETLFAPIYSLGTIIITGFTLLIIASFIVIYLYVVRYAKKELLFMESNQKMLQTAALVANIDPLTGAYNRRLGTQLLTEAFQKFKQGEQSPTIMLFDLDKFKHINDSYGHEVGDISLIEVVNAIKEQSKTDDMLFRWGGDEFVGYFYDINNTNAEEFSDKILNSVSSLTIKVDDFLLNLSVSIGISYFKETDANYNEALKRADIAMYQSKQSGGNKATFN